MNKNYKYVEASGNFNQREDNDVALDHMRHLNHNRDCSPQIGLFWLCLTVEPFQREPKTFLTAFRK